MFNKTNLIAVAIIAAAAFTAAPSANATVAGGMSATAAATTAAATTIQADVVLAGGRRHRHGHRHWRHGWGGGVYYGDYGYGFGDCQWLKRKAIHTGRRYWWNRYHNCRNSY